jgi:hypothetical protein
MHASLLTPIPPSVLGPHPCKLACEAKHKKVKTQQDFAKLADALCWAAQQLCRKGKHAHEAKKPSTTQQVLQQCMKQRCKAGM